MRLPVVYALVRVTTRFILLGLGVVTVVLMGVSLNASQLLQSPRRVLEVFAMEVSGGTKMIQNWTCIDRLAAKYNRVEDIFCMVLPEFVPHLKNPCFYDYNSKYQKELRCLPYFYIIGMDKSGSTDLHSRIVQHPFVMGNKGFLGKETSFWSWLRYGVMHKRSGYKNTSLDEYLDMFEETAHFINKTNIQSVITGDATPMDLWDFRFWPKIPQNQGRQEPVVLTPHLLKYLHGARIPKFIIQFREPVERLYSDYVFLKYGKNPEEFHNHTLQAIEMVQDCLRNFSRRLCFFLDKLYQELPARLHLGCYSVFLREWLNVFPRDNFLITTTDEYENNMNQTLNRVFKFLELPLLPDKKMEEILNQARRRETVNKTGTILPETVVELRQFYDEYNQDMARLLSDDRFLWLNH